MIDTTACHFHVQDATSLTRKLETVDRFHLDLVCYFCRCQKKIFPNMTDLIVKHPDHFVFPLSALQLMRPIACYRNDVGN